MTFLHCFIVANLASASVFLFSFAMIQKNIWYSFWGSDAVVLMAIGSWLVVFIGLAYLTYKNRKDKTVAPI